jgi:hypothetical protein
MSAKQLIAVRKPKMDIFVFNAQELDALAGRYQDGYNSALPYPHLVIDDFLPADAAARLLAVFPSADDPPWLDWRVRDTVHQPLKQGIGHASRLASAHPFVKNMMFAFNSSPMILFLEALTGIRGLIPDPHLSGGGLHQSLPGGKLSIHADFNYLESVGLYRRINLLLYLNKDWKDDYGGHLELWDHQMSHWVKRILPAFNRCVIFNTSYSSYHGHPDPLACPPNTTRKSIAFCYYARNSHEGESAVRATSWQARPTD